MPVINFNFLTIILTKQRFFFGVIRDFKFYCYIDKRSTCL